MKLKNNIFFLLAFLISFNSFILISYSKDNIFTDSLIKKIQKKGDLLGSSNNKELIDLTIKTKGIIEKDKIDKLKNLGCNIISQIEEYLIVQLEVKKIPQLSNFDFIDIVTTPTTYNFPELEKINLENEKNNSKKYKSINKQDNDDIIKLSSDLELKNTRTLKNSNNNLLSRKKIKIAVIDSGFDTKRIPNFNSKVKTYSMRLDNDITAQGNWKHGNAVLEIISKQTPDAEYYLLNIDEKQDALMLLQAIKHAVEVFDADIISLSLCDPHPRDFFDGTGIYGKYIKNYTNKLNKIFVVSAGNNLKKHYSDVFYSDKNSYHDFRGGKLQFQLKKNQTVRIFLSWKEENFYRPNYNLDLELLDQKGNKYISASKVKEAVETMEYTAEKDDIFTINIKGSYFYKNKNIPNSENLKFHVILYSDKNIQFIEDFKPNSSLDPNLPVIPEIITVSSVKSSNPEFASDFSSRGIPENKAYKPDFSAPSGIKTSSIEYFEGTSASVPYVTGIIADILAKNNLKGEKQLKEYLKKISIDKGIKGWDNIFGYGLLLKK